MNNTMKVKFDWNKEVGGKNVSGSSVSLGQHQSFVPGTVVTNAASIAAARPNSFMQHLDVNDSNSNHSLSENLTLGSSTLNIGRGTFGIASSLPPTTQTCCLSDNGVKCPRPAGNASYSKRIQKMVAQKKLNLVVDKVARHIYICEHHKGEFFLLRVRSEEFFLFSLFSFSFSGLIQTIRVPPVAGKRKRKEIELDDLDYGDRDSNDFDFGSEDVGGRGSGDGGRGSGDGGRGSGDGPQIDLLSLPVNALRRYKKHFHIQARPGVNKPQLAEQLSRHLRSIPIIEKEAITYFIYMVRMNRNKLDKMDPKQATTAAYLDCN